MVPVKFYDKKGPIANCKPGKTLDKQKTAHFLNWAVFSVFVFLPRG
jgi:hypothetical protein